MKIRLFLVALVVAAFLPVSAAVQEDGFTVKLQIDISNVVKEEKLYEVGPAQLSLRFAGKTESLKKYDKRDGNYVNFPLPDGTCPVLEATLPVRGGRVGIPLGALARPDGVHEVTLNFSPVHWTIGMDGLQDDDMPPDPKELVWPERVEEKILSSRIKKASFITPALVDAFPKKPDSRRITRPIQYWTPDDPNAWVGDVAVGVWKDRFHVFYLFDRRHHSSGGGSGRHYFAHISSANLVTWDEHPHAIEIEKWWETLGTGTPFVYNGKFHLSYGLHTSRLTKDPAYPSGGTYAVSEDGIHFTKTGEIMHGSQNPTVYNRSDGKLGLVSGYGKMGSLSVSDHLGGWKVYDDKIPAKGDCPCLFEWNGHSYLFQGFSKFAYSPSGNPGTWVDWAKAKRAPYDGLSVPMVAPFGNNRRIKVGWLMHVCGWGGWLVFRELIQEPDGSLGTKWVPEIPPPTPPVVFTAEPKRSFRLLFRPENPRRTALAFHVNPETRTAVLADDVKDVKFQALWEAHNLRIENIPTFKELYKIRVVCHYDRKSDATIFDIEIGGKRTMICRRPGKFKIVSPK